MNQLRLRANDHGSTTVGCKAIDLSSINTSRKLTDEGFLVAPSHVARTGIQRYRASELGLKGYAADKWLNVLRPQDEVFHPEAMKSFDLKTVANDHPPEDVTADNWKAYASDGRVIGDVSNITRDGDYLGATLVVRDKDAIASILDGKSQLSCGYTFDADQTPGEWQGAPYDLVQRNIRGNHVAVVDIARGGPGCRIADRQPNDQRTTQARTRAMDSTETAIIRINGRSVRVVAADASLAQDAYDTFASAHGAACDALKDLKAKHAATVDELKMHKDAKEAAEAKLDDDEGEEDEEMEDAAPKKGKDSAPTLADRIVSKIAAVRGAKKKAIDAGKAALTAKEAELTAKIPTAAQDEARVAERMETVAGARKLIGDSFKDAGKTIPAIHAEAVAHVIANDAAIKTLIEAGLKGVALDKAAAGDVAGLFAVAVAAKKTPASAADAATAAGSGATDILRILAHDDGGGRAADSISGMSPTDILKLRSIGQGRLPGKDAGI